MSKQYRTGIIITGDPSGGVKAVQLTEKELKNLNATQTKGQAVQKKTRKETDDSSKSLKEYSGKLGLVSVAVSALTTVIGGIGIASIVKETVSLTKETTAWANAVGVSTQELQASDFAAQAAGLSQGKIGDIYKDTAEKIADAYINGGGEAADALKNINLSAADLVNLSPDKQLLAIAGGLDAVGSNAAKIQVLESLASDASLLIPLLDNDAEKLKALKREAVDSGVALSNIDTAKISVLSDVFRSFDADTTGLGNRLTVALSPAIFGVSQEIDKMIEGWGGMGNVAEQAVEIAVSGLGFILDVGQEVKTLLKQSEVGWVLLGKAGIDAFVGAGGAGVELLNIVLQPVRNIISTIVKGYGYLIKAAADFTGNESWKKAAEFVMGYSAAIKDTEFKMKDFLDLQKDIENQLIESNAELQALINAKAPSDELKKWLADQRKEIERMASANLAATNARKDLTAANGAAVATTKELTAAATPMVQIYNDTASSIRSAFSGAFRDIIDGQNSFSDRMKNIFKDMLADMATMAISKPIIIPMVSSMGSALGISDAAQSSVIAQLGGQQAATASNGAALTAQASGESGFMQSAGSLLGQGFMGYMAGGAAAKMFDVANPKMAQNLTAVGTMIGGPVGGAIGFVVGSMFNGKWATNATGLSLNYDSGSGVSGYSYQDQIKKGGQFSLDKNRRITEDLDAALAKELSLAFDQIEMTLVNQVDLLNNNLNDQLDSIINFTTSSVLDTTNLNLDQVNDAITEWVGNVTLDMAQAMIPGFDAFRRSGETGVETLDRLTVALTLMNDLGRSLDITIASLTAGGNAAEQYAIQLSYATADIATTTSQLANTADMQTRIELEQQYAEQVIARYELEQEMLKSLQDSISTVASDVSGLRGNITNDIAGIIGSSYRDSSQISADLSALTPGSAPQLDSYLAIQNELDSVKTARVGLQLEINSTQSSLNALQTMLADPNYGWISDFISNWVGDLDSLGAQIEAQYAAYEAQVVSLTNSLEALRNTEVGYQTDIARLESESAAAQLEFNNSLSSYLDLTSDQVSQLQNLREETINYYNAMLQLDNAMSGAAANIGSTLESLRLGALSPAMKLNEQLAQFTTLSASAAGASGYDLVTISDQLNALVDPLLSGASSLFASGQGYQDVYNQVVDSLTAVQQQLVDGAPKDYEQSSLGLLNSIDSLLGDMQDILTAAEQAIVDAINTSREYTVGTLEDIRQLLGGEGRVLASYDSGTAYVPRDMTANIHQGEIIFDPQTSDALRRYGIPSSGGSPKMIEALNRIERLLADSSGDLRLTVVTPDGRVLKEETITDIKKRSKFGESIVHANGVFN